MIITRGNHDDILKRKAKTVGLPVSMLSDMNKIYGTRNSWKWVDKYMFDTWGGYPMTVPMITDIKGRWDGVLPRTG